MTEDCPCRAVHPDSHDPIADCSECGGLGIIEVDDFEDDAWQAELAEINAELDYFADDEAA